MIATGQLFFLLHSSTFSRFGCYTGYSGPDEPSYLHRWWSGFQVAVSNCIKPTMMFRTTTLFALLLVLFAACEPSANSGTDSAGEVMDKAEEMASETQEEMAQIADMSTDGGGTLVVLDDKIKSPRKELSGEIAGVPVKINYGSPAVKGRVIYGDLVPYEKVWRTGANEATRITFEEDVVVGADAKKLKAGTYSLFTLPKNKEDWMVIFNTDPDQWGAYDYDDSKDAVRAVATAGPISDRVERMDFRLAEGAIQLMWDDLIIEFPVASASK